MFVFENGIIKHLQGPKTLLGRLKRTTKEYWGIKVGFRLKFYESEYWGLDFPFYLCVARNT